MSLRLWNRLLLLTLGFILGGIPSWGCSVPVFRYALEHWSASPFEAFVFHRGPLTDLERAAVRDLGPHGLAGALHANISLRTVDLDQDPPPELLELMGGTGAGSLPWLVVKFPAANRRDATIWAGPLHAGSAARLLDSPARKEIVQRISDGQSAVWVLLESGDAAKDAEASGLIEERLKYLASVLELPRLDAQDIANGLVSVGQEGLRLDFSLLRISRTDASEQPFVRMLLGSEADLDSVNAPIVFPVFGQGRALYAIAGEGIKPETIDKAASFLIGKCSCEVKEQNPGMDLLLAADWKALLESQTAGIPDLPTMAELTKSAPATVTVSPVANPGPTGSSRSENGILPGGTWALVGALAVAAWLGLTFFTRAAKR